MAADGPPDPSQDSVPFARELLLARDAGFLIFDEKSV